MVRVQTMGDDQKIEEELSIPKYRQLANIIITSIRKEVLKKRDKLPSINEMSVDFLVSRDTVCKAYQFLLDAGYIYVENRRGYFISENHQDIPAKICMIAGQLNEKVLHIHKILMANKKIVSPQLQLHHYSLKKFVSVLSNNVKSGCFEYFVIFPHIQATDKELVNVLKIIPPEKLIILDKAFPYFSDSCSLIYKKYVEDLGKFYEACRSTFKRFQQAQLVLPDEYFPAESINVFKEFCEKHSINYKLIDDPEIVIGKGNIYVVMSDYSLVKIIKGVAEFGYKLGKDVGVILLYETSYSNLFSENYSSFSYNNEETASKILEVIKNRRRINYVLQPKIMI